MLVAFSRNRSFVQTQGTASQREGHKQRYTVAASAVSRGVTLTPRRTALSANSGNSLNTASFTQCLVNALFFHGPTGSGMSMAIAVLEAVRTRLVPRFNNSGLNLQTRRSPDRFVDTIFQRSQISCSILLAKLLCVLQFHRCVTVQPLPYVLPYTVNGIVVLIFISSVVLSGGCLRSQRTSGLA